MKKFDPDNIYLDFLLQDDIKDSRFVSIEIFFPLINLLFAKENLQREHKIIKGNGRKNDLQCLNINPQKLLGCDSNYDNDFSVDIIKLILGEIHIENLNYIGRP